MMERRGQISIFVIVAIVIVGVILVVFSYPKIVSLVSQKELVPGDYLKSCLEPQVKSAVDLLAKQGGDEKPIGSINYQGVDVKYLCYASGYYKTCTVQQPLLMSHFASELSRILSAKAEVCGKNLVAEYQNQGYSVSSSTIKTNISLYSEGIKVEFIAPMTVTKDSTTKNFDKFDVVVDSKIYDLLAISTSIIDYEATYGDSETTTYLKYYPDLKIEKIKLEDGVKIYKLTNVVSNDMFQFATRSLVWPPGYGL